MHSLAILVYTGEAGMGTGVSVVCSRLLRGLKRGLVTRYPVMVTRTMSVGVSIVRSRCLCQAG